MTIVMDNYSKDIIIITVLVTKNEVTCSSNLNVFHLTLLPTKYLKFH